jgi:hypothetical protein
MAEQQQQTNWTPFILGGLGLYAINKLLGGSPGGERALNDLEKLPAKENPFNTSAYRLPPKKTGFYRRTISSEAVIRAAKLIFDGFGYVQDDEAQIMLGFKMAGTRPDIYLIAGYYATKYKRDLWGDLFSSFTKGEGEQIALFVMSLPNYHKSGIAA